MMTESLRTLIPVPKIETDCYDWYARHEEKCRASAQKKYRVIFIGDSLTHFWTRESERTNADGMWNDLYDDLPALNLGFGFDRTQNVLWRLDRGEMAGQDPRLIILNIGTNQFSVTQNYSGDDPHDAAEGILAVIGKLQEIAPHAAIAVMALFPRGGKTPLISGTNAILHEKLSAREGITLIDLTHRLGDENGEPLPEYYNPDLCHVNQNGYRIWAEAIAPMIRKIQKGPLL